jgi:methyltransferase (TIGR00027 family)
MEPSDPIRGLEHEAMKEVKNMNKIKPQIKDGVADTLFIPLLMRSMETQHPKAIIHDEKAVELANRIDYDFSKYAKASFSAIGTAIRVRHFDQKVATFINKNQKAVVVNVGCGLDTRFYRVADGSGAVFYELDLPEVINLREQLLPAQKNDIHLRASMLETEWMDTLLLKHPDSRFIFIIEGVFMYFLEEQVRMVIQNLAARFHGGELHFDVVSKLLSKQSHRHDTVKYAKAKFQWGLDDEKEIETWTPNIRHIETQLYMNQEKSRWGIKGFIARHIPAFLYGSKLLHYEIA